eukprot:g66605.t1
MFVTADSIVNCMNPRPWSALCAFTKPHSEVVNGNKSGLVRHPWSCSVGQARTSQQSTGRGGDRPAVSRQRWRPRREAAQARPSVSCYHSYEWQQRADASGAARLFKRVAGTILWQTECATPARLFTSTPASKVLWQCSSQNTPAGQARYKARFFLVGSGFHAWRSLTFLALVPAGLGGQSCGRQAGALSGL